MAREWVLAGVSEEELKPSAPIEPPKTPKGKWQNFWYHYKPHVWITAFVVLVAAVCTWQVITRNDPDYRLVVLTKGYVSQATADFLGTQLAQYGEDLDEDGTVEVMVEPLCMDSTGNQFAAHSQKFTAYLASGDVMFFAMEPSYYEERIQPLLSEEFEFFTTLPSGELQWSWKGSPLQQNAVLKKEMPEELLFGVRVAGGMANGKEEQSASAVSLALLKKVMAAEAPAE